MKPNIRSPHVCVRNALALLTSTWILGVQIAAAQGTAFTYQGRLTDGGWPANGLYDLRFVIYDAASGGSTVGGPVTNAMTAVSNGLFTVTLDFGASVFTGAARWLEIGVRTYAVGSFTNLSPRQPITSTPYAIRAANFSGPVAASQLTGTISPSNLGAGTINSAMLATGAVTTAALAEDAVTADKVATVLNSLLLTITNPVPTELLFGLSVAAVGSDRFAVGGSGEAYLFNINGGLLTAFTNPISPGLGSFGISVAAVGSDRVLIGAQSQAIGGVGAGAAFLFYTNAALLMTFTNPTPAANDNFGSSVAAVGNDRVLIGAVQDDTGATNAGAAYLFSTNGALLTTFTNPTPAVGDAFGVSVAAVGSDRVLIGAQSDNTNSGAAYLFSTDGTLLRTFTNPVPRPFSSFGRSVATVANERLLIGEPFGGASGAGAAYLFSTNGTLLTTFTNPFPAANDNFGISVAAVGNDRVVVGAWQDDTGALDTGSAYLFSTNGTILAAFNNPTPAEQDSYGSAVAGVGNNRVLIGAYTDDTGAGNAGAVYLFNLESFTPGLVADTVRASSITATSFDPTIGVWTRAGNNVYRPSGNVGIGTSNPGYPLDVAGPVRISNVGHGAEVLNLGIERGWSFRQVNGGASTALELFSEGLNKHFIINTTGSGAVGIAITNPIFTLHVNGTAGKPGGGSWGVASDARLKKNIRPLAGALDKLLALRGVNFEYIDPAKINELSGERMGLLAQEVEKVFPDWVETGADGYKRVTVRGLEALVVEALRELQQKQEANDTKQAAELKRRDTENAELKQSLAELKASVQSLAGKQNGGTK